MTQEQIQGAQVGEITPSVGPIHILDYDPEWPRRFERETMRIKALLGEHVLLIEHVGSTSVPGLAAKPIIDIVLGVGNSADEPTYVPTLEAAAYVLRIREPDWHEHRMFKGHQPSCLLVGLPGDRPHAALPQLVAQERIRSSAL